MEDRDTGRGVAAALVILGTHNVVQNTLLNERGYVAGNLVVSGLLLGLGRSTGLSWAEMGLGPGDTRRALRIGVAAGAATVITSLVGLSRPQTRAMLVDERTVTGSGKETLRRLLVRFPLGTALFEEIAFRGVLPALLRRRHRPLVTELMSASVFGLWHLIPTGRAVSVNHGAGAMEMRHRAGIVLGSPILTGVGGLGFGLLRKLTGNLLAPWLAHSAFNGITFLAGVVAVRLRSASTREASVDRHIGR